MSRWRRAAALLGVVAQSLLVHSVGAQTIQLTISNPKFDSMPPAPVFLLEGKNTQPNVRYSTTLELSTDSTFSQAGTFRVLSGGVTATLQLDSLLVQKQAIFLRARLTDDSGRVVAQSIQRHPVQAWLTLEVPSQKSLVNPLTTRTPTFAWSSPAITLLWQYQLTVINRMTGERQSMPPTNRTFLVSDSLEANTSYSWEVTAHAGSGATEVTVKSAGTFVIGTQPAFTLLYQNFPNPFGRNQRSPETCFWFDLDRAANVQLTIYDLRLHQVRRIIPGPMGGGQLSTGLYGRDNIDANGCDPNLSWDGRDDRGNFVPQGVYIARFMADGKSSVIKMLYMGPP
jgi:hypothetical protein